MKKSYSLFSLVFIAIFCYESFGQTMTFSKHDTISMKSEFKQHSAFGDYDNDGDLDFIVTQSDTTVLFQNGGNPGYAFTGMDSIYRALQGTVHFVDYNNDNSLDILLTGFSSLGRITKLYKNSGAPGYNFTEVTNQTLLGVGTNGNNQPRGNGSNMADFDNDGDLDILLTGRDGSANDTTVLYWNMGGGVYTPAVKPVAGTSPFKGFNEGGVYITDYNKDGYIDFFINGELDSEASILLYKNLGGGIFSEITAPFIEGRRAAAGCAFDVNNDGSIDFITPGYRDGASAGWFNAVFLNAGSDDFTFIDKATSGGDSITQAYAGGGSYIPADFNNDGHMDYAANGNNATTLIRDLGIYLSDGARTYTAVDNLRDGQRKMYSGNGGSLSVADFDNDGDVDIYTNGWQNLEAPSGGRVGLFTNNISTGLVKPNAPGNLTATSGNSGAVDLSWDAISGQFNITYNVYVMSVHADTLINAPMADLTNGFRKIAAFGNAFGTKYILKNLNDTAEYTWSVQTIDQRYIGSAFAEADTFALQVKQITVTGKGDASAITSDKGTLQMETTVLSPYALDKSVTWSISSGDAASISPTGLLTALGNGKVTVKATANDGSDVYGEKEITLSNQSASVNNTLADKLEVYPNPSNEGFVIDLGKLNSSAELQVLNITGSVIYRYNALANETVFVAPEIFTGAGIYYLRVENNDIATAVKLIVD